MEKIVTFFHNIIAKSSKFNSLTPVDDVALLVPDFLAQVKLCIKEYQKTYPNQDITFTETYRSNALQQKYYTDGASKIMRNGMHHYGIAADCIFVIDGKRSYKGDILLIRKIFNAHGLTTLGMWDSLHVQFIPVSEQKKLRKLVG